MKTPFFIVIFTPKYAYTIYKMSKKTRVIGIIIIISALIVYNIAFLYTIRLFDVNFYIKIFAFALNIPILFLGLISVIYNYKLLMRWMMCISVLLMLCGIIYFIITKYNLISKFNSTQKIQALLSKYGAFAGLIYIVIQFLQVTFIPVPTAITTMAGVALFGVWKTFLYSCIGIIAGSLLAFYLGKKYGIKLFVWLMGDKMYQKYQHLSKGRDKIVLTMMFIFPLFPDDLLCIAAGLTNMTYFQFFIIMLISRPLNILAMEGAFKGISSIPLTGYGIPIWIALISLCLIVVIIAFKYSHAIEDKLLNMFEKISNKLTSKFLKKKENKKNIQSDLPKSFYDKKRLNDDIK